MNTDDFAVYLCYHLLVSQWANQVLYKRRMSPVFLPLSQTVSRITLIVSLVQTGRKSIQIEKCQLALFSTVPTLSLLLCSHLTPNS